MLFRLPLRSRHAMIIRHRGKYWIVRHPGHPGRIAVDGALVAATMELTHGSRIELGGKDRPSCVWEFQMPVNESATAVMVRKQGSKVFTPSGSEFDHIVLLDDELFIRSDDSGHIRRSDVPCESVRLRWSESGLIAESDGGVLCGIPDASDPYPPAVPHPLLLPAQFTVGINPDPQQILELFQNADLCESALLSLNDPFLPRNG